MHAPPTFILDAYNILPEMVSKDALKGDLEAARDVLEARLRSFRRVYGQKTRIILVYDGERGAPPSIPGEPGFEVRFSRPPRKADDVILELTRQLEGEGEVHVVTSDYKDIGQRVRALRVRLWSAREFAALVERRIGSSGPAGRKVDGPRMDEEPGSRKPGGVSPADAEAWVKEFGFGEGQGG